MMNAVQHRINVDGHLNAHGGFNFGENNRMGVATVGTSREPINSWLPLYVCDQHWQRVKVDFIFTYLIHFSFIFFGHQKLFYFCAIYESSYHWQAPL